MDVMNELLKIKDKNRFSIIARIKSATHAWRGIVLLFKTTHNAWLHIFFALVAVFLGFFFNISNTEWLVIVFAIGIVIVAEAFNTAIEIDIDLTSPEYHPYARDTKDVSAGAVLLAAITALVIGIIVFLPKIFDCFKF
jgi:diacylglycerol kinase